MHNFFPIYISMGGFIFYCIHSANYIFNTQEITFKEAITHVALCVVVLFVWPVFLIFLFVRRK